MATKKRAGKVVKKEQGASVVVSDVRIDMGTPDQDEAIIAAVHRALDVLHQIRLTPRYGIYVEAQKDE